MNDTAVDRAELTSQQRAAQVRAANNGGVHPGGRSPKYRPEMCDALISLGKEGAGRAEMSAEIGITRQTWSDWIDPASPRFNPEFSCAVKEALELSQAWWERKGRESTFDSKDFNATSYIFQMKNRFKEEWADRQINEQTGTVTIKWGKAE